MHTTKLKERRKNKGYSQPELAKLSNVPQTTISGWEAGISDNHAILRAIRIARALQSTVEDLFPVDE